ncbi:unnamed protein product, partial [Rotaria magnacalcarata]
SIKRKSVHLANRYSFQSNSERFIVELSLNALLNMLDNIKLFDWRFILFDRSGI